MCRPPDWCSKPIQTRLPPGRISTQPFPLSGLVDELLFKCVFILLDKLFKCVLHLNTIRNSLSCTVCENLLSEPYTPEVKYLCLCLHLFIHVFRCAVLDPTFQLKGRFSHMGASLSFSSFENTCSCRRTHVNTFCRPHVNTFWRIPKQCTCRRPRVNTMFARVARVV